MEDKIKELRFMALFASSEYQVSQKGYNAGRRICAKMNNQQIRKRAFKALICLDTLADYLYSQGLNIDISRNLYKILPLNEEFEFTDIHYNGRFLDILPVVNGKYVLIPKIQYMFGIIPDLYVAADYNQTTRKVRFLGCIEGKKFNKTKQNEKYFIIDTEELLPPDLIEERLNTAKPSSISEKSHELFCAYFIDYIDGNLSDDNKKRLITHLIECKECRDSLVEFFDYETIAKVSAKYPDILTDHTLDIVGATSVNDEKYKNFEEITLEIDKEPDEYEEENDDNLSQKHKTIKPAVDDPLQILYGKGKNREIFDLLNEHPKKHSKSNLSEIMKDIPQNDTEKFHTITKDSKIKTTGAINPEYYAEDLSEGLDIGISAPSKPKSPEPKKQAEVNTDTKTETEEIVAKPIHHVSSSGKPVYLEDILTPQYTDSKETDIPKFAEELKPENKQEMTANDEMLLLDNTVEVDKPQFVQNNDKNNHNTDFEDDVIILDDEQDDYPELIPPKEVNELPTAMDGIVYIDENEENEIQNQKPDNQISNDIYDDSILNLDDSENNLSSPQEQTEEKNIEDEPALNNTVDLKNDEIIPAKTIENESHPDILEDNIEEISEDDLIHFNAEDIDIVDENDSEYIINDSNESQIPNTIAAAGIAASSLLDYEDNQTETIEENIAHDDFAILDDESFLTPQKPVTDSDEDDLVILDDEKPQTPQPAKEDDDMLILDEDDDTDFISTQSVAPQTTTQEDDDMLVLDDVSDDDFIRPQSVAPQPTQEDDDLIVLDDDESFLTPQKPVTDSDEDDLVILDDEKPQSPQPAQDDDMLVLDDVSDDDFIRPQSVAPQPTQEDDDLIVLDDDESFLTPQKPVTDSDEDDLVILDDEKPQTPQPAKEDDDLIVLDDDESFLTPQKPVTDSDEDDLVILDDEKPQTPQPAQEDDDLIVLDDDESFLTPQKPVTDSDEDDLVILDDEKPQTPQPAQDDDMLVLDDVSDDDFIRPQSVAPQPTQEDDDLIVLDDDESFLTPQKPVTDSDEDDLVILDDEKPQSPQPAQDDDMLILDDDDDTDFISTQSVAPQPTQEDDDLIVLDDDESFLTPQKPVTDSDEDDLVILDDEKPQSPQPAQDDDMLILDDDDDTDFISTQSVAPQQQDNNISAITNENDLGTMNLVQDEDESFLLNINEDDSALLNLEEQPLTQIQNESYSDDLLYYDGDEITENNQKTSQNQNETPDYDLDYIDDIPSKNPSNTAELDNIVLDEDLINPLDTKSNPPQTENNNDDLLILDDDNDTDFIRPQSITPQASQDDDNDLLLLGDDDLLSPPSSTPPASKTDANDDDLLILDDEQNDDSINSFDENNKSEDFIRPASMQDTDFIRPAGADISTENSNDDLLILDDNENEEPITNPNKTLDDNNDDLLILDDEEENESPQPQENKAPSQLDMILNTINNSKENNPKEIKYDEDGFEIKDDNNEPSDEQPTENISQNIEDTTEEEPTFINQNEETDIVQEPFPDAQEQQEPQPEQEIPETPKAKPIHREFKDAIAAKEEAMEAGIINNSPSSIPADEPLINSSGEDEDEENDDKDEEFSNQDDSDDEYDDEEDDGEEEEEEEEEDSSSKKGLIIKISIGVALLVVLIGAAFAAKTFLFKDKNTQTEQALEEGANLSDISNPDEPAGGIVVPDDNNTKQTETNPPVVDEGGISIPASGDNPDANTTPPTPPAPTNTPKAGTQNATTGDMNKAVANAFSANPSAISIHKVSWGVSASLATDAAFKKYLQSSGKKIQTTIQSNLSSIKGTKPTSAIKVQIKMSETGGLQDVIILQSSGVPQIDTVVLQSVKQAVGSSPLPTLSPATLQANEQASGSKTVKMSLTVTF